MIVGQRHERSVDTEALLEQIDAIKRRFGIEEHYLEKLLDQ